MAEAADYLRDELLAEPDITHRAVFTPCGGHVPIIWQNILLSSPKFRHAHLESFEVPDCVSVLHVCIFPHFDDPGSIFGFDMIAGRTKVTGIFLDYSATIDSGPKPRLTDVFARSVIQGFAAPRARPTWATVFSEDFVAVRPSNIDEVEVGLGLGARALTAWLSDRPVRQPSQSVAIRHGQARYVEAQRSNQHTFRMLAGFVGAGPAKRFIEDVLFPSVG